MMNKEIPRQFIFYCFLMGGSAFCNTVLAASTNGIITDGSMGAAKALTGVNVAIPQNLGTTMGANLFHSFSDFNIAKGQTVEFTGSNALQNVISRVTGANISSIEGTLRSSIPNAAFYLINPNGITFGTGAQINVLGAFHVSTADQIKFKDGNSFSATNPSISSLTSATPASFGYLGTSSVNNGLLKIDGAQLAIKAGQTLDMVAGEIDIENNAKISIPAGEVRLVAMQGSGTVDLEQNTAGSLLSPLDSPGTTNAGSIILNNSKIDLSGNSGGRIVIWGGNALFKVSCVNVDNSGITNALSMKGVNITANYLGLNNSYIKSEALYMGKSGDVTVQTKMLDVQNWGVISADTSNQGNAGNVTIHASSLNIFNGGYISSSTKDQGNAGNLTISADSLKIDAQSNSASIFSIAKNSSGQAGNIKIQAKSVNILNGGEISNDALAQGNSGNIFIKSELLNVLNGGKVLSETVYGQGNAGKISIQSGTLNILDDNSIISSSTHSNGRAGDITISSDILKIAAQTGRAGIIAIATDDVGGIGSGIRNIGQAANVTINAGSADILKGGYISNETHTQGAAGDLTLQVGQLNVIGGFISSASVGDMSSGKTGNIKVTASNWLHFIDGSIFTIKNHANLPSIDADLIRPGFIFVTAPDINIKNSSISSASTGNVAAGNININFSHWLTMDPSSITTTANIGNGGNININGGELIYLQNSNLMTTVSGAISNGGDIAAKANMLVMDTGLIQANSVGGSGGNINLNVNTLIPSVSTLILGGMPFNWQPYNSGFNVIQAASQAGINGVVNVTAPQLNLSGILSKFADPLFKKDLINQDFCSLDKESSLTRKGNGGLKLRNNKRLVL